jgi:hypothetical protein
MDYIANKQITTFDSHTEEAQRYERGETIPADAYNQKTIEAWLKKGIIRPQGAPEPEPIEAQIPEHEDGDVVPNKSRQAAKTKKS